MKKLNRRGFLKLSSGVAGAVIVSTSCGNSGSIADSSNKSSSSFPTNTIAQLKELKVGKPKDFNYPDKNSPCILIKLGNSALGGVGPDKDVVAFSKLCSHMGCPVLYDSKKAVLKCGCHFSIFDPGVAGQQVCGQATEKLPQVVLDYDSKSGAISATGMNGIVYGRQSNI